MMRRTKMSFMLLNIHTHDNVFSPKLECFNAFCLFVDMAMAFWGLKLPFHVNSEAEFSENADFIHMLILHIRV